MAIVLIALIFRDLPSDELFQGLVPDGNHRCTTGNHPQNLLPVKWLGDRASLRRAAYRDLGSRTGSTPLRLHLASR